MKITRFKGDLSTQKAVDIEEIMEGMKTETEKQPVSTMRHYLKYGVRGTGNKYVNAVPVLLFGGTYRKADGQQVRTAYNGLILTEVNNLASENEVREVRNCASTALQTYAAFMGSGGRSVKILSRFSLPDGALPQEEEQITLFHANACLRANLFYQELLNRRVTAKKPEVARCCRMTFDEDLYYNPQSAVIPMQQPLQMPDFDNSDAEKVKEEESTAGLLSGLDKCRIISSLFESSFHDACEQTGGYADSQFKPFLVKVAENCFASGIPEDDAVKWICVRSDFRPHEMEVAMTVRNVYACAKGFGKSPCISKEQVLITRLQEFMKRRFDIRYNVMKMDVEYRERRSFSFLFSPLDDRALNGMSIRAHKEGINVWDKDVRRYVYSDAVPLYSPMEEYLLNLPVWDGKDHIRKLAGTLVCDNPRWEDLFYKWFVSMAAHWVKRDTKYANSVSPLLIGSQGCGKSTWCRNLLPPDYREYYTDSFDLSNKRKAEMNLTRFGLINIDEFDSISNSQQAYLKHILQKPVVSTAAPYQSSVRSYRRFASFIGTSNNFDLLTDPTGSRRFICIHITQDIDLNFKINYEQLYAQALAAVRAGEQYWYTREEELALTEENREFEEVPVEEQLLMRYFRHPAETEKEEGEWMPAISILQELQRISGIKMNARRIAHFARILRKHGFETKRTKWGSRYKVMRQ